VEIQSNETLGHFANWLSLKKSTLRYRNKMSSKSALVVGSRLKLDFSNISVVDFEKRGWPVLKDSR
jgi:membrane-bound lytic murein transglycosylase D